MLGGVFAREERAVDPYAGWGVWPGDAPSSAYVTPLSSLQLLAVYGSVRFISDGVSGLPVDIYRRVDDHRLPVDRPLWLDHPTPELNWMQWAGQMLYSMLLQGNAYASVYRNANRQIVALEPYNPDVVQISRFLGVRKVWVNGREFSGELLHIPGPMLPGSDVGLPPVEMARQAISLGLSAQQYGKSFFDGEGNMPGVIEMPRKAQPGSMKDIADNWVRKRKKGGKGLPGVLDDGATWKATGVTNEQAQFLATRGFTDAQIAGQMFLLDPTELGIPVQGTSITYANLEQRNARRAQVTYLPWIMRLEKGLQPLLLPGSFIKLNVDALLRADLATRSAAYEKLAAIGVLTVDEMRELEDREPLSAEDKKQSRSWQEVGLPALVEAGLMTINEARAQLGLIPVEGGDVAAQPFAAAAPAA